MRVLWGVYVERSWILLPSPDILWLVLAASWFLGFCVFFVHFLLLGHPFSDSSAFWLLIEQVIERRNLHPKNLDTFSQPSVELQLDSAMHAMLNKEIAEKTRELRRTRGEDLQGLNMEELEKLEKLIEGSLCRVIETKGEKILKEADALKSKEQQLIEENQRLKQRLMNLSKGQGHLLEQGQSSDSMVTNISSTSANPRQDCDNVCSFLTLGLPFPD
ncbi:hypothetical protein POTOM_053518 [Populus tomentosa]|uniref:K-box domain-containing protein n=1 Tax=Populus tomentosa TaxID=118781 RepID=A0A8X8C664_POPTO|nr:hypothetical protein POTOM_053518 [Populus tomentosa]